MSDTAITALYVGTEHFIVADKQGTIQILQLKQEGKDDRLTLSCVYASEDNIAALKRPIVSLCYEGKISMKIKNSQLNDISLLSKLMAWGMS